MADRSWRITPWLWVMAFVLALAFPMRGAAARDPAPSAPASKAVVNATALSGLWYDPASIRQGYTFAFGEDGRVAVTWYVYDSQGRPIWLIGNGELVGEVADLPSVITAGGLFPPAFSPSQVQRTPWGNIRLTILSCDRIRVEWGPTVAGFGAGSQIVQPLIIAGGLPCQVTARDDHGDTCRDASPLVPGGSASGAIGPSNDQDVFRIVLDRRGELRLRTTLVEPLDPFAELLDQDCELLLENDDSGDRNSEIRVLLQPGTYFARLSSFGAASAGNYTLDAGFDPNVLDDAADACEGAALVPANGAVLGRVQFGGDADHYRVVVTQPGVLSIRSEDIDTLDPVGAILDANCNELLENDDVADGNRNFSVSAPVGAGTYHLRVRSYSSASVGPFRMVVGFESGGVAADEHGDSCATATPFSAQGSATGRIGVVGDVDVFRFTVTQPGTFSFATSESTGLDPFVSILDADCALFSEDDDAGPGLDSGLSFPVPAGTYFARVRAAGAGPVGPYRLTHRFVPLTPGTDEHGGDCASATPLEDYYGAIGRLEPGSDEDFFRFDIEEASRFEASSSESSGADPVGALLGADCTVLAENDDTEGEEFRVAANVPAGRFYLRVRNGRAGSTGEYQIRHGLVDSRAAAPAAKQDAPVPKASALVLDSASARSDAVANAQPKAVVNPISLTGLWYDPANDGQGYSISFTADGRVAVAWYVYEQTRQLWIIGSDALTGNRATMPMFIGSGGGFPPNHDPAAVNLPQWGTLELEVLACDRIRVRWTPVLPGYTAGTLDVVPLLLAGGLPCEVTPEADDHGNSCAAATSSAIGASVGGRIDPSNDEDFFRLVVGSAGTLSVRSGGLDGLDARGALLDANCTLIVEDADPAAPDFTLDRTVTPGTYFVRVAARGAASVGSYRVASAFTPTGGSTASVTVTLDNALLYDVDFDLGAAGTVRVAARGSETRQIPSPAVLAVGFELVGAVNAQGAPIGDLQSGSFAPVANPTGTVRFELTNRIGNDVYFAPVIGNKTSAPLLLGANFGTPDERRCNCTVGPGVRDGLIGYYRLRADSNVRGYGANSNYAGSYVVWGADPGGQGSGFITLPIANQVQAGSGRTTLQAVARISP